ncbi:MULTISPECIES: NAD(P)/FAD-dependent oxidoreductase [Thermocrispum]|uniref:NAD(P)/FAD-dependent oxidoreductase n=1 Tax=Thermocrispum agreste TaxID=37925 RepID=A0A2W4JKV8_9PSEU|nr:MAG: NAD(P)/FAD-dependent oxidoreductase [Thermocrispum agreste]
MVAQHTDVLIIGAGLSGVGAACHLRRELPEITFTILERRDSIGGTWDLFRYPGVRSDSDMYTLGYRFKPWPGQKAIADGPSILRYVRKTASEYGIDRHIRFGHRVVAAEWSSDDAVWRVTAEHEGEKVQFTCNFLWSCSGYYDYDSGYTPQFEGVEDFTGTVVHPQHWPEDLDYAGKRVVVIGSGATAVTLVPAMALGENAAEHVTMLQRSPTYIVTAPSQDPLATLLRRFLPDKAAYVVNRWRNILVQTGLYQLSRRRPQLVRRLLKRMAARQLPPGYDVDTHFSPSYDPWDQRMCLVPDGDLFKAIRSGKADVVTDHIDRFTEKGIRLRSGVELPADIIVTATGLKLLAFGGMTLTVDGKPVELSDRMAYKGIMLSGVPNFAYIIGYTNASWTLKADLACEYVCRVLRHMRTRGHQRCEPVPEPDVHPEPFIDLKAGYVLRSLHELPKQGDRTPWRLRQNYLRDIPELRHSPVEDGVLTFSR